MKYFKYFLMLLILFVIPFSSLAEDTCEESGIIIKNITLKKSIGSIEENSEANVDRNTIVIDIQMSEVGDSVEYEFTVENKTNKDFYIDDGNLDTDDYIQYDITSSDNSNLVNKKSEKDFYLRATYTREVDYEEFLTGKYNAGIDRMLNIHEKRFINPETGRVLSYILIMIIFVLIVFTMSNVKNKKLKSVIVLLLLLIPFKAYAEDLDCVFDIELKTDVIINYFKPNPCTFDGELVTGAEYTNGQYIYRYKQRYDWYRPPSSYGYYAWIDLEQDGWGVKLADPTSTDPVTTKLCTSINEKPLIATSGAFYESQATSVDLSSFDTTGVLYMGYMFYHAKFPELDLKNFDTSSIIDMYYIVASDDLLSVDMSGFDFSRMSSYLSSNLGLQSCHYLKTLKMNNAKFGTSAYSNFSYLYTVETIELNNADFSQATSAEYMFNSDYLLKNLGMENWDMSKVTSIDRMFYQCKSIEELDLSKLNFKVVQDMDYVVSYCEALKKVNLSGIVNLGTTAIDSPCAGTDLDELIVDDWIVRYPMRVFEYVSGPIEHVSAKNWVLPEYFTYFGTTARICNVKELDVTGWDLNGTKSVDHVFYEGYSNLSKIIGIGTWKNTNSLVEFSTIFCYCYGLEEIDLRGFDYSSITKMYALIRDSRNIKRIYFGDFNAENLEDAENMLYYQTDLEEIYFDSISTPKLTKANYMFYYLPKLKTLDLTGMDVSHVTSMYSMLSNNSSLETLNLSTFDINPDANINYMFQNDNALQTVYVKNQNNLTRLSGALDTPSGITFTVYT